MSQVIQASAGLSDQTGRGYQQHLVYLVNSGKWLLAWQDSSDATKLKFLVNSTPDFTTGSWSAPTGSPYTLASSFSNDGTNRSGANHHLTYKNIAGNDVLHIEQGLYNAGFRFTGHIRAHFSGSTLTVDSDTGQIAGGGASTPQGVGGTIASNNCPAQVWDSNTGVTGYASADADTGSSWSNANWVVTPSPTLVASTTSDPNGMCLWPMSSGKLLALHEDASDVEPTSMKNVFYFLYNGSAWGVSATAGFTALGAGVDPNNFGAVNCGTSDVHCVLRTGSNTYSHRRFNGTSWSAGSSIPNQNSKAGAGLAMASDGTNVWLVIIDSDVANTVRFIRWTPSAGWDATWTALETSSKTRNCISVANAPGSSVLGVIWTETNGATFDIAGTTLTLGQLAPLADWPVPRARIPAISLRTHVQATPLNLLNKDTMFGAAGQPRVNADQPTPPRGRAFPISNRGFVQGGSALLITPPNFPCGQIRLTEWPVPRGRAYPVSLRTFTTPLSQLLLHQDQFFGVAGEPPCNRDWPVPRGRTAELVNRTFVQPTPLNLMGQDVFYAGVGQPPEQRDFPNPRGRAAAIALRTHVQCTPLNLQDTFFGAPGEPPTNRDWPVPRGRLPPIVNRTHVQPTPLNLLGQDTFYAGAGIGPKYDWPNPRGRHLAISNRTHLWRHVHMIGQDSFGPYVTFTF